MKKCILSCFLFIASLTFSQVTIHGTVTEIRTEKRIPDVQIFFEKENVFISSDSLGEFTVTLSERSACTISHIAYEEFFWSYNGNELSISVQPKNNLFPSVIITDTRAGYTTPLTTTNIRGQDLNENNFGEDMPQLLEFTPSVVVTSDAGNGLGYTGIRIRGSDATRINVTINGVPYNDAESQQTYWVDINDIAESVGDIQIQRGVGSSQNGISAFGGAINITTKVNEKPYGSFTAGAGSFNLLKTSASFGTGRMNDHWLLEGRISKINADGYIDRSFSDLFSFSVTAAYRATKYTSMINIFSGKEKTYQSWGGVPEDSLLTNRTYNPYTYANQTDNYLQTHYQWHNIFYTDHGASLKLTFNYTNGLGYYEQLENGQYFSDYGVSDFITGNDTLYASDMITQKWLDNEYYGAYMQYENEFSDKLNFNAGAAAYRYTGSHFGKVIWAEFALPFGVNYEWYSNNASKNDANVFTIINYALTSKILLYTDLQMRSVRYNFTGFDEHAIPVDQSVDLLFFNPKAGISYAFNSGNLFYCSVARSGHEPNRDDYTESSPQSRPAPEILYDAEAGYKMKWSGWQLQSTVYYMHYKDQLVLTGEINDVGAYTRTNIPVSYRAGLELAWAKTWISKLTWNANIAVSENKIKDYTSFIDNWDTGEQMEDVYANTTIAFSPSCVAASKIQFTLYHAADLQKQKNTNISVALQSKYVSRQFIDNTGSQERSLDPYFINDLLFNYSIQTKFFRELILGVSVQNVFDAAYESNAWVYRFVYEETALEENGYFPQAGRNLALFMRMHF